MLGKPLEMASHLSLTTVIFSLLRRYYYIRVTKISRSVTSTCCCYTPSSSRFSIRDRSRSRFVEIESSTSYLFNPPRRLRSILPPSRNSILTFLSDPTIQICIKFHAHAHTHTLVFLIFVYEKRKFKRIIIVSTRSRKKCQNFENFKFEEFKGFILWEWMEFFANGVENENTFRYWAVINSSCSQNRVFLFHWSGLHCGKSIRFFESRFESFTSNLNATLLAQYSKISKKRRFDAKEHFG